MASLSELRRKLATLRLHRVRNSSNCSHIFIIGPPRSGTTLLHKIMVSNSKVVGPETETYFFCRRQYATIHVPEIPHVKMQHHLNSSIDKIDLFDKIAAEFTNNCYTFCEKTPEHALVLDSLLQYFPKSYFVFMVRDPRDGWLSLKRNPVASTQTGTNFPRLWASSVFQFQRFEYNPRICLVKYEDLCSNPVESLKHICGFMRLDFEQDQLDPEIYSQNRFSSLSGHTRLNERITDQTVYRWRFELDAKERKWIESIAGNAISRIGYEIG